MKNLFLAIAIVCTIVLPSCEKVVGEGPLVNETRTTGSFSGISAEISGNVYYVQGPDYKVELTAQQNILNVIETPVINNKLVIRFKNNVRVRSHEQITIRVTAPSISSINSSGSGSVTVMSPLSGNNFSFHLSGSGNMTIPSVTTSQLEVNLSGSGGISINGGTTVTETLKISGSGNIDVKNVAAESVTANTSGSGTMRLSASQTLDVTISGSGSVFYLGNPVITSHISGSGTVGHL